MMNRSRRTQRRKAATAARNAVNSSSDDEEHHDSAVYLGLGGQNSDSLLNKIDRSFDPVSSSSGGEHEISSGPTEEESDTSASALARVPEEKALPSRKLQSQAQPPPKSDETPASTAARRALRRALEARVGQALGHELVALREHLSPTQLQQPIDSMSSAENLAASQASKLFTAHSSADGLELAKCKERIVALLHHRERRLGEERAQRVRAALDQASSRQPQRKGRKAGTRNSRGLRPEVRGKLTDPDAFLRACVSGRLVLVRAFIQNGGDVNSRLPRGPPRPAADHPSTAAGSGALELEGAGNGEKEATAEEWRGCLGGGSQAYTYGLLEAVSRGHLEVAAKLLASNASTDVCAGPDQETPMHVAVKGTYYATTTAASAAAAMAAVAGASKSTPPTTTSSFRSSPSREEVPLDPRMMQLLLQCGADPNARTSATKRTPLIALAASAEAAAKKVLAVGGTSGASPSLLQDEAAVMRARGRVAELLLREGGAEPGASDAAGRSALCYARSAGPLAAPLAVVLGRSSEEAESTAMGPGGYSRTEVSLAACWRGRKCTFCGDFWRE